MKQLFPDGEKYAVYSRGRHFLCHMSLHHRKNLQASELIHPDSLRLPPNALLDVGTTRRIILRYLPVAGRGTMDKLEMSLARLHPQT